MNEWKLYISAAVFIGVTILKLLFPEQSVELRNDIAAAIDMDMDYRGMVHQVGVLLTDDRVQEVLHRLQDGLDERFNDDIIEQVIPTFSEIQFLKDNQSSNELSASVKDAMAAYFESQLSFGSYSVPSNVRYEEIEPSFEIVCPVEGVCSSGFGYRMHPLEQEIMFHYGTDYSCDVGTAVMAFGDGYVSAVGEEIGYGNYVELTHADGWKSFYAHCSEILVQQGQSVHGGELIARSGETGRVTGPHLHFELTHDDMYTNPEFYLS